MDGTPPPPLEPGQSASVHLYTLELWGGGTELVAQSEREALGGVR